VQQCNKFGSYAAEVKEELARVGQAFVTFRFCHCSEDGLYHYSLSLHYSYGGFSAPISAGDAGFANVQNARAAAVSEILTRLKYFNGSGDPEHAQKELRELKSQIEKSWQQPDFFDIMNFADSAS
jgi:hypothetical protein